MQHFSRPWSEADIEPCGQNDFMSTRPSRTESVLFDLDYRVYSRPNSTLLHRFCLWISSGLSRSNAGRSQRVTRNLPLFGELDDVDTEGEYRGVPA